jgi:hypothetical protein
MFCESFILFSMRPGDPFIAPRQLGAIGDQHGRLSLPSVEWCNGQSGARSPSISSASDPVDHAADRWCWQLLTHRTILCTTR